MRRIDAESFTGFAGPMDVHAGACTGSVCEDPSLMQVPAVMFSVRLIAGPAVQRELTALVGPTRAQPGCLQCELLHDAKDPSAVVLVSEWATRADLDRRLRSDDCRRLLAAAELAGAPPEFRIDTVASREGIEAIAAARGQSIDLTNRPDTGSKPQ
jgi:quinol monooxygenase YgiN